METNRHRERVLCWSIIMSKMETSGQPRVFFLCSTHHEKMETTEVFFYLDPIMRSKMMREGPSIQQNIYVTKLCSWFALLNQLHRRFINTTPISKVIRRVPNSTEVYQFITNWISNSWGNCGSILSQFFLLGVWLDSHWIEFHPSLRVLSPDTVNSDSEFCRVAKGSEKFITFLSKNTTV
jgi:hypothetical protein